MKGIIRQIAKPLLEVYPADEAESLAWWVAEETTGLSHTALVCSDEQPLTPLQQQIIERLLHWEPIQYIFGHTQWNGLDLKVSPATLIPRPETAELVERINSQMTIRNSKSSPRSSETRFRVLDIGTGSGCIAIALKKVHPEWEVAALDISPEAVEIARENAMRNKAEVRFLQADILSDEIVDLHYDLVVSNPPYICEREKSAMRPNVLAYEPASALFVSDTDPLLFYRRIATLYASCQTSFEKYLFFEVNEVYGAEVAQLLLEAGYTDVQITQDIYGKDRIVEGRMA